MVDPHGGELMRRMLLTLSIGSYIHIETNSHSEDRRYTKTNTEPVVLVPAYGNFSGNIYYFWAVVGWSKEAVSGNVNTPQYTSEYTVPFGEKSLYVLTLDGGAYRPGDAYIAYRNAKGTVQVTLMPPTQENCYDLTPSTLTDGSNKAIQEAGAILETLTTVRTSGIAPRSPGGGKPKRHVVYLGKQGGSWSAGYTDFTYNVKANYPKIYADLTKDNFRAVPYYWNGNSTSTSGNEGGASDPISYDANTGIVRCSRTGIGPGGSWAGTVNYQVYMVYYD